MNLNFIFFNLNIIILSIWIFFLFIVVIRFLNLKWIELDNSFFSKIIKLIKNISFYKFIIIAFTINIIYVLFISWGQYYVWATANDFTKILVNLPISKEVPIPYLFEWARPFFEHKLGYFLYYILGHFWLNIFISFFISSLLYFLFKIWKSKHGNFSENGPELLFILMLIVGWPLILIFIPLGFIFSVFLSIFFKIRGKSFIEIEPAFIMASLIILIFGKMIFNIL